LAKIPTADAYTVIIQYSQAANQSQHLQYTHHGNHVSKGEVERLAFEGVKAEGGINPKIVVSTGKPGYFAIATGKLHLGNRQFRHVFTPFAEFEKAIVREAGCVGRSKARS
jgi:hypothetical protein